MSASEAAATAVAVTLIDTDVLIWNLRGNQHAADVLDRHPGFCISAVTYMELIQGLRDNAEFQQLRQAIRFWEAAIVPINEWISARASYLVEEYALSDSLQMADALIAATALETGSTLLTRNIKRYRTVRGVSLEQFRP